jgi:hypothetical protein
MSKQCEKQDILDVSQHFIVSDLWIYKYYKDAVKALLQLYKKVNECTSTELYKLSYEIWLSAQNGIYKTPSFKDWCIDMKTE